MHWRRPCPCKEFSVQWAFYQSKPIRITKFPENIVIRNDNTELLSILRVLYQSVTDGLTVSTRLDISHCLILNENFEFWFRIQGILFEEIQLTTFQPWFRQRLVATRQRAIIWINVDQSSSITPYTAPKGLSEFSLRILNSTVREHTTK